MGNIAISVEKLGKRYRIGLTEKQPNNLREAIRSFVGAPFHYLFTRMREPRPEELIWALKDVSFEVKHGEVLGIIGRNGAGKSTLLKILSRITEPTSGQAKVYGRVGSLLEVGTGFHQELTGRENIYLNGTILGMRRAEIDRQFDEIVDFSGVEKFLDTPVKRYSSGMYVRLAFAVAAHLEPEILLIDEVLAVGDIKFQEKCLGKLDHIAKEGRTVLFVSHNMTAMKSLATKAILLKNNRKEDEGAVARLIDLYLGENSKEERIHKVWDNMNSPKNPHIQVHEIFIKARHKSLGDRISMDDEVEIGILFEKFTRSLQIDTTLQFKDERGNYVFTTSSVSSLQCFNKGVLGKLNHHCFIPANFFNQVSFTLNLLIVVNYHNCVFLLEDILRFAVISGKVQPGRWMGKSQGALRPKFDWKLVQASTL